MFARTTATQQGMTVIKRTPATAGIPVAVWMQVAAGASATAGILGIAGTPLTRDAARQHGRVARNIRVAISRSNAKNSMRTCKSRDAQQHYDALNSRNTRDNDCSNYISNIRFAKAAGTAKTKKNRIKKKIKKKKKKKN